MSILYRDAGPSSIAHCQHRRERARMRYRQDAHATRNAPTICRQFFHVDGVDKAGDRLAGLVDTVERRHADVA